MTASIDATAAMKRHAEFISASQPNHEILKRVQDDGFDWCGVVITLCLISIRFTSATLLLHEIFFTHIHLFHHFT